MECSPFNYEQQRALEITPSSSWANFHLYRFLSQLLVLSITWKCTMCNTLYLISLGWSFSHFLSLSRTTVNKLINSNVGDNDIRKRAIIRGQIPKTQNAELLHLLVPKVKQTVTIHLNLFCSKKKLHMWVAVAVALAASVRFLSLPIFNRNCKQHQFCCDKKLTANSNIKYRRFTLIRYK